MVEFAGKYIYHNNKDDTPYNRICEERLALTADRYIVKVICMVIGGYASVITTIYASFYQGNKTSTISCKVPFIEAKSDTEFYLNYTLQWIILFHSCVLYFFIETTMTIFENFCLICPPLIHLEFIEAIKKYEDKNELSVKGLRTQFRNAMKQALDYERYVLNPKYTPK